LPLIRVNVPLAVMGTLPDLHASGICTLLVLGTPKTMAANDYVRLTDYLGVENV
jgi:hypothetical protein